ncbi:MAG TPA: 23S rRNA (uridine(2552)-2'-O)-methyltransferase RlmE [Steroidobacteraceae bacterium]|nr:23S rRNA (uridine(2552)-2'-O)-methyltransferase RlmE [Steroidobacteraceae bacterium]
MARSKSSGSWLQEHVNDPYVKQARQEGYRSRASYKLIQLNERDKLMRPGMLIVDLGSAPGGWSQVAAKLIGPQGKIVATDILPMEPLKNVDFIQGDFTDEAVLKQILARLEGRRPDLILCDIAPNISGIDVADQAASMYLVELALDMARQALKPRGDFVTKVFQGAGSDAYLKELRGSFEKLTIRKPAASRPRSREVYAVAKGFKGAAPAQS